MAGKTESVQLSESLYRARTIVSLYGTDITEFDFPPNRIVPEGRYNHSGMPVLYLGSSPETCVHEMRDIDCNVAEIKIKENIKILDLINAYEAHEECSDLLSTLVFSALRDAVIIKIPF